MQHTLTYTLLAALFSTAVVGGFRFNQFAFSYKLLFAQVLIALAVEVLAKFVMIENTALYNIYILFEVILIVLLGIRLLKKEDYRKIAWGALGICVLIWGFNIYSIWGQVAFANKAFLSNCILITALFCATMLQTANHSRHLFHHPLFWLSLAHMLYFGCVIPYFSLYDYFTTVNPRLGGHLFKINTIVAILRYSFIGYAFHLSGGIERVPK